MNKLIAFVLLSLLLALLIDTLFNTYLLFESYFVLDMEYKKFKPELLQYVLRIIVIIFGIVLYSSLLK